MMKKKRSVSGFTLIEVIVAMTILGIMSMLMVTLYSTVTTNLKNTNQLNDRMSEQQRYIESKASKTDGGDDKLYDVIIDEQIASAHKGATTQNSNTKYGSNRCYVEFVCVDNKRNTSWTTGNKNFVVNCAIYSIKNIEDGEVDYDDDDLNIDYKYFVGDISTLN